MKAGLNFNPALIDYPSYYHVQWYDVVLCKIEHVALFDCINNFNSWYQFSLKLKLIHVIGWIVK